MSKKRSEKDGRIGLQQVNELQNVKNLSNIIPIEPYLPNDIMDTLKGGSDMRLLMVKTNEAIEG